MARIHEKTPMIRDFRAGISPSCKWCRIMYATKHQDLADTDIQCVHILNAHSPGFIKVLLKALSFSLPPKRSCM